MVVGQSVCLFVCLYGYIVCLSVTTNLGRLRSTIDYALHIILATASSNYDINIMTFFKHTRTISNAHMGLNTCAHKDR